MHFHAKVRNRQGKPWQLKDQQPELHLLALDQKALPVWGSVAPEQIRPAEAQQIAFALDRGLAPAVPVVSVVQAAYIVFALALRLAPAGLVVRAYIAFGTALHRRDKKLEQKLLPYF